jgi:flagellar hook assembly protein FlgD
MELKKINLVFDSSPEKFSFLRSFPNPFNSTTTIQFSLGENPIIISPSAIQIYDLRGNLVKTLPFSHSVPGNYSIKWDGTNELGKPLSSGIYFVH